MFTYDGPCTKSLDEWSLVLRERSGDKLMKLHPSEVFLSMAESGGAIVKDIRRDRCQSVISNLGLCLFSLFDVYNRVVYDPKFKEMFFSREFPGLNRFVFNRFPRRCPHCGEEHCLCAIKFSNSENRTLEEKSAIKDYVEEMLDIARANEKPPEDLDDFRDIFKSIYGQCHQYMNAETICLHLLEEIGELAKALRDLFNNQPANDYDIYNNFMNEIADILSWIFALWRKIEYRIENTYKDRDIVEIPELSEILAIVVHDTG